MTMLARGTYVGVNASTSTRTVDGRDAIQAVRLDAAPAGRFGAAVDVLFEVGHRYRLVGRITVDASELLARVEVHGHISRTNSIYLDLTCAAAGHEPGSEVRNVEVAYRPLPGDLTEVSFTFEFTAVKGGRRHVYVFGTSGDSLIVHELGLTELPPSEIPSAFDYRVVQLQPAVHFSIYEWYRIDNYLHLRLAYHHGSKPTVGIRIRTETPAVTATVIGQRKATGGRRGFSARSRSRGVGSSITPIWRDALVESPNLESIVGAEASHKGYRIDILLDDVSDQQDLSIGDFLPRQNVELDFVHDDGSSVTVDIAQLIGRASLSTLSDTEHLLFGELRINPTARILEIGGNGPVSAALRSSAVARYPDCTYTVIDVNPGTSVDVVGDAQHLDRYFAPDSFDIVYSASVLEHVGSVELVPAAINRVLTLGGKVIAVTPFIFPLHAEPTDFWRFTDHGLEAMFGPDFGFQVEDSGAWSPCRVVPTVASDGGSHPSMQVQPSFLTTFSVSTKVSEVRPDTLAARGQRPYSPEAYFDGSA